MVPREQQSSRQGGGGERDLREGAHVHRLFETAEMCSMCETAERVIFYLKKAAAREKWVADIGMKSKKIINSKIDNNDKMSNLIEIRDGNRFISLSHTHLFGI